MNDPRLRPSHSATGSAGHNLWVNQSPTINTPSAGFLLNARPSFDPVDDVLYAVGPGFTLQIWAYHPGNKTWTNLTPASGGPDHPMGYSTVVYSQARDRILIFGGARNVGGLLTATNQTWLFDPGNTTWTNLSGGPAPPARFDAPGTYYPDGDMAILNGGCDRVRAGNICDRNPQDTWGFSFTTGTWASLKSGEGPSGRSGHQFAYDPETRRILTFSGYEGANDFIPGDTWYYDVPGNQWTQIFPSSQPVGRHTYGFSFDGTANRFVLFGGWGANFKAINETWAFDWSSGRWQNMAPPTVPGARMRCHMAFDRNRGLNWMYGGGLGDTTIFFDDVWTYDLGNVSAAPVNVSASPGAMNITVSWTPPSVQGDAPVTGYSLLRGRTESGLTLIGTVGNGTSYTDKFVAKGTLYYYAVRAANLYGESPRSNLSPSVPLWTADAPTGVEAWPGDGVMGMNWTPPAYDGGSPVTNYTVRRGTQSGVYTHNVTVGNVTGFGDSGLSNGQDYFYGVSAVNAIGTGPLSVEVRITPRAPAVPPRVVATIPAAGETGVPLDTPVQVVFDADMEASSTSSAFEIHPVIAGSGTVAGATLTWAPGAGFSPNTTYTVTVLATARSAAGENLAAPHSFSFTSVPTFANVSGRITSGEAGGVPGAMVDAFEASTDLHLATTTTRADGSYQLRLENGRNYYLEILFENGTTHRTEVFGVDGDRRLNVHLAARPAPVAPWAPFWLIVGLGLVGTLSALAVAGWVGGEAVKWMLLLLPIILYSRLHREKVLDHFVRGQIYGHIRTNPGATFTEIATILGVANGVLTYHLYTLEKTGFIRFEREGRWKRFYPREAPRTRKGVLVSHLQKEILEMIKLQPGVTQSQLAARLGTKRQNVNYNVLKLVSSGLVRLDGRGFRKRCIALPQAEPRVIGGESITPGGSPEAGATGPGKERATEIAVAPPQANGGAVAGSPPSDREGAE